MRFGGKSSLADNNIPWQNLGDKSSRARSLLTKLDIVTGTQQQQDPYNCGLYRAASRFLPDTRIGRNSGSTDEIAKAIVFLASQDGRYVNGLELSVDGDLAQI